MIFRGNAVITPNVDTELKEGDVVAAIVTPASEEQIKPSWYFSSKLWSMPLQHYHLMVQNNKTR